MSVKSVILKILSVNMDIGEKIYDVEDDESLFDYGMDSLQMMRSIVEIEKTLKFQFCDEDLLTANFTSIASIALAVEAALLAEKNEI